MAFQLMTSCKNYSYPIDQADKMWANPDFDPKKKTVLLATGWTTTINETGTIYEISRAYFCRGDVNFIVSNLQIFCELILLEFGFSGRRCC